jgi:8-oxo-dGTP diphosphatase
MSSFTYDFPRPALTADTVLFAGASGSILVLLIRRGRPPFEGQWAFPGGFVDDGERVEDAARRELAEETGIVWTGALLQVGAFGDPGRDPRGWTTSVVWAAHVGTDPLAASGSDDAEAAEWFSLGEVPSLAFDHDQILEAALARMRESDHLR